MATTDLQLYGAREEVQELGARLQNFMPSAQALSKAEAMAVAQIALAHGLDPFNGEVWGIKGTDGSWYGIMVGVKGLRKSANAQARKEGFTYWTELVQVAPEKYGEPTGSIVYECVLRDTMTTQAWGMNVKTITSVGGSYKDALEMLGKAPCVVGIGIATPGEKSKMKIHQRAKKRAEADAIKMRFQVSFGAGVFAEGDQNAPKIAMEQDPDAVDGHAEEMPLDHTLQSEPIRSEAQNLSDLGFSEPPTESPRYRASGVKIVGIVAEITGLDNGSAAQLILKHYKPSDMLTEIEAGAFAQSAVDHPSTPTVEDIPV